MKFQGISLKYTKGMIKGAYWVMGLSLTLTFMYGGLLWGHFVCKEHLKQEREIGRVTSIIHQNLGHLQQITRYFAQRLEQGNILDKAALKKAIVELGFLNPNPFLQHFTFTWVDDVMPHIFLKKTGQGDFFIILSKEKMKGGFF